MKSALVIIILISGIRVVKITPDGAAEKDGRIQVGDEVVTINEVPLADKSQLETINLLKEHDSAKITLIRSDGAKVPYSVIKNLKKISKHFLGASAQTYRRGRNFAATLECF